MDIEYLIYFNKIAETGNISQAARKLSLSQPALSRILKNIETTLGTPLFDRNGRAISLNEYGKTFYDYSRQIVSLWDQACLEISHPDTPNLNIAALYSTKLIPDIIRDFVKEHSNVKLHIARFVNESSIISNTCVAIHSSNLIAEKYNSYKLFDEECLIGVSKKHPFAHLSQIPPEALSYEQFIVINKENTLAELTYTFFDKLGFTPNIAMECDSQTSVASFVASNLGIAIFPTLTWDASYEDIVFKTVAHNKIVRSIYISMPENKPSQTARMFVKYFRNRIEQCFN